MSRAPFQGVPQSREDFKAYDPEVYKSNARHERHAPETYAHTQSVKVRKVGASHFTTSNRSSFQAPPKELIEAARKESVQRGSSGRSCGSANNNDSDERKRSGGGGGGSSFHMRHVPAQHFTTSSREKFPCYDRNDYAQNESRLARENEQSTFQPRHVGAAHFKTITESSFPVYDVKKIMEQNQRDVVPPQDKAFRVRHVSKEHFQTSTKSQFRAYDRSEVGDCSATRHHKDDVSASMTAGHKTRHVAPAHFTTSNQEQFKNIE